MTSSRRPSRLGLLAALVAVVGLAAAAGSAPVAARVATPAASGAATYAVVADAYVSARRPRANFGRAKRLLVRGRPATRAFLAFDLRASHVSDPHVTLQLWVSGRGSVAVRALGTAKWRERRITWRNAPKVSRKGALKLGSTRAGKWVQIDLTSAVLPGGVVTVALLPGGRTGSVTVSSRESSHAPKLSIAAGTSPPPPPPPPASPPPPAPPPKNACGPPYSSDSPWNTPISSSPAIDPNSQQYVNYLTMNSDDSLLTSDPTQYSYPVFNVDGTTAVHTIRGDGTYSNVSGQSSMNIVHPFTVSIPVPIGTAAANGSDGQAIILNPATGDEWAFWQLQPDLSHPGDYQATNGYHYNTNWNGVPPKGFGSRGPGMTYLDGLIRPCEIMQGHIDHAIAFAFRSPSADWVYPATKSDGNDFGDAYSTVPGTTMRIPEGGRFQLDPTLTDDQLGPLTDKHGNPCSTKNPDGTWQLTACLVIAHALQKYGMIVADHAGRSKIYAEYSDCDATCTGWTAHWGQTISGVAVPALDEYTANAIPLTKMRVLKLGPLNP